MWGGDRTDLSKYSLPQVITKKSKSSPVDVLMFMHTKGITHSASPTTISLQRCVIINGLEYTENAKTPHFLKPYPVPNNVVCMNVLSLSWVVSFLQRGRERGRRCLGGKTKQS